MRLDIAGLLNGVIAGLAATLVLTAPIMMRPVSIAGIGLFGMKPGLMAPLVTLLFGIFFGVVLGWLYGNLDRAGKRTGQS